MNDPDDMDAVRDLHRRILESWNADDAAAMAAAFADDGAVVGFDGSQIAGRAGIAAAMGEIFRDHETGSYVAKVRSVRALGEDAAVLSAVAGMVPAGKTALEPKLNAVQALVAERRDGEWRAVLYQNTPARFDGRPEMVEQLTEELQRELG